MMSDIIAFHTELQFPLPNATVLNRSFAIFYAETDQLPLSPAAPVVVSLNRLSELRREDSLVSMSAFEYLSA